MDIIDGIDKFSLNSSENIDLIVLLKKIISENDIKKVAERLNVANGTVKRWIEQKKVPKQYSFELMKIDNIEIDYSKFSSKDKDQFFTPVKTAIYCYNKVIEVLKKYKEDASTYRYIEPSAGNGNFLNILPKDRRIGLDIDPKDDKIIRHDYLTWSPPDEKKNIVIGNPPFGLRGHLALKFINHSIEFADYVCFILPQLFESDGKGVPRKRVIGYNLIHSEKLKSEFEEPCGKNIKVECIFQIWSKYKSNIEYDLKVIDTSIIKIYSLSDGGTPSTTRNKKMFEKCDIYIPSTCFGKENMRYYDKFEELPGRRGYGVVLNKHKNDNLKKFKEIEWCDIAFLSTNSAYNIRMSQISSLFESG
jgi:hypothetical protein